PATSSTPAATSRARVVSISAVVVISNQPVRQHPSVRRRIILLASVGLFLSGYNNFIIGLALLQVKPVFHLSASASGGVAAATLAGMLVGSLCLGRLADNIGRRPALLIDLALVAVFAIVSAVVSSGLELTGARLLLGLGIGAGYPIGSSFVADVSPDRSRGRLMTLAFSGWGLGAFGASLVGWLIIRDVAGSSGWRWMLASGAVPAVAAFGLVALAGLPESPRWKASQLLAKLPVSALASPSYRRSTLAALLPWFLMDISVYGIGLYTPTLLTSLGFHHPVQVALGTLVLSVFTLAGFCGAAAMIDRLGRRPLQMVGFLGMAAALALLAVAGAHPGTLSLLGLFAVFQFASNAGPNTTTWIVPAELFPTRLRATGQGAAVAFSRVGAVLGVLLLPDLVSWIGLAATLSLVAATSVAGAIATSVLLPETARCPLSD
ncbi:MAG: MFS transporter, partial [Acidimicrobiales bacterium]